MTKTIACVKHKDGWCACAGKTIRYREQVKTLCNHFVILPKGLEYRQPTCDECLKLLSNQKQTRLPANWRNRIEITRSSLNEGVLFTLAFKRGQTPQGFMKIIGELNVNNIYPHIIEDIWIDKYFYRRRLGTLLCTHALNFFKSLTTYYHTDSNKAKHLWKSLIRKYYFETDFLEGTLTIFLTQ